jgi:hypothetical protein
MIDIKTLNEKDIGRQVVYSTYNEKEEGHITSFNDKFIFVDYGSSCGRGIATDPQDLDFSF